MEEKHKTESLGSYFIHLISISLLTHIAVIDASLSMRMSKDSQNKLIFMVGGVFNRSSYETYRSYEDALDNLKGSSMAIQSPVALDKYPPSQVMFESLNPYRLMMQYCEPSSSLAKNTIAILAACDHDIVSFLTMIGSQLYMPVISLSDRDWTFSFKVSLSSLLQNSFTSRFQPTFHIYGREIIHSTFRIS